MTGLPKPVQMAVVGAPHGIRGEVRVKSFTADPLALGSYGPLVTAAGRTLVIQAARPAGDMLVVRFKGVDDRDAAQALNGVALFVDRSALPDDEEEDEFYQTDLVGLAVRDGDGAEIGRVTAVHNFGGGDILEIVHGSRKGVMIPFTRAAVPEVSVAQGFVRVDPHAAGLIDAPDEDGPA